MKILKFSKDVKYKLFRLLCRATAIMAIFLLIFGSNETSTLLVKPRLQAEWQTLDLTNRALTGHTQPADWSGGFFFGSKAIEEAFDQLVGYKLEYIPTDRWLSGTVIQVKSLQMNPTLGYSQAKVILCATHGETELTLNLIGKISFNGVTRASGTNDEEKVFAKLRIEPLDVTPNQVRFSPFEFSLQEFWGKLAPDLLVALASPDIFEINLPLDDSIKMHIGGNENFTDTVNKATGATLTYQVTMPQNVLKERLSYLAAVFRPEGICLLAMSDDAVQGPLESSRPPNISASQLQEEVRQLRTQLVDKTAAFGGDTKTIAAWISPVLFTKLVDKFGEIPDNQRKVTIQSLQRSGKLVEAKWRDDFLGDGGYYAELGSDNSASVVASLGRLDVGWDERGMSFKMPVKAELQANVHVHFDPLIGNGIGTSIGLEGNGSGLLNVIAKPTILDAGGIKVAALNTQKSCDPVNVELASDGKLKIDLGWISVPKIGVRTEIPLDTMIQIGAIGLYDSRPIFMKMPVNDPRLEGDPTKRAELLKQTEWAVIPPVSAIKIVVEPLTLTADASGLHAMVRLKASPLHVGRTPDALDLARTEIEHEAKSLREKISDLLAAQQSSQQCTGEMSIALLLGPVEIGPHNEVVKWAREGWNVLSNVSDQLRNAVESVRRETESVMRSLTPPSVYIAIGKSHGGWGVQIGGVKF